MFTVSVDLHHRGPIQAVGLFASSKYKEMCTYGILIEEFQYCKLISSNV